MVKLSSLSLVDKIKTLNESGVKIKTKMIDGAICSLYTLAGDYDFPYVEVVMNSKLIHIVGLQFKDLEKYELDKSELERLK
jgi:hypothetical protein